MDKNEKNKTLGIGMMGIGIVGFLSLYSTHYPLFILSGFILPGGIYFYLKTRQLPGKRVKTINTISFLFFISLAIVLNDLYENNELSENGIITKGRIADKKRGHGKGSWDYVVYDFKDQQGIYHRANQNTNISKYEIGDTLDVVYSGQNMEITRCGHTITKLPDRWSFLQATWESKLGIKMIAIIIVVALGVMIVVCSAMLIGLKIMFFVLSLFVKN